MKKLFSVSICLVFLGVFFFAGMVQAETELKIMIPGDKPDDFDEVQAVAEERLASEGMDYKLNVVFVPWGQLADKMNVTLASGERVDLVFDAPWIPDLKKPGKIINIFIGGN